MFVVDIIDEKSILQKQVDKLIPFCYNYRELIDYNPEKTKKNLLKYIQKEVSLLAMTETKVVQTKNDPVVINDLNNEMGCFGWNVLSIQITHNQNTKTYTKCLDMLLSTGIDTVETTTIEYATITYQRDRQMANFQQITDLERQYFQIRDELVMQIHAIEASDRVSGWELFLPAKPSLNPVKAWQNYVNKGKRNLRYLKSKIGMDGRSEDTIQKTNELLSQFDYRLSQIRNQAEALL